MNRTRKRSKRQLRRRKNSTTNSEQQHKTATLTPVDHLTPDNVVSLQQVIGNQRVQRLLRDSAPQSVQSARQPALPVRRNPASKPVQRFLESEHKEIGDEATQEPSGKKQTVELAPGYHVTYGDMVAMGGDYFESIGQIRSLAAVSGTGAGTREEVEYVRVVKVHGHKDKIDSFSESAVKAADKRYYTLATGNRSHFLNPEVGDEARSPADKADGMYEEQRLQWEGLMPKLTTVTKPLSAGAGYRYNHVQALFEAYFAGLEGKGVESALATEAFSNHYLTDAFAGGHVRTPRVDLTKHWHEKVPMFNYNLKGFIAEELAKAMSGPKGIPSLGLVMRPDVIYHGIPGLATGALETVTKQLDAKAKITFGDVVAGAVHDYDNEHGVPAEIVGHRVNLKGDSHLGEGDEKEFALDAVRLSKQDVLMAWNAGKAKGDPVELAGDLIHDGLFAAEELLPQVVPDSKLPADEQRVRWDFDNVTDLFSDGKFIEALKIFADEKAEEFAQTAEELEDADQQKAFTDALVKPLQDNPVDVIWKVIHWTPDTGGGALEHNQDDNAMDYYYEAKKNGALGTLQPTQKINLIIDIIDGPTIGDEETAIWELLISDSSHARQIIDHIGWARLEDEIDGILRKNSPGASRNRPMASNWCRA